MKPLFSFCVSVVVLFSFSVVANAESLRPNWCRNANSDQEKYICRIPELSKLDVTMVAIHDAIRAGSGPSNRHILDANQEKWFTRRSGCKIDKDCIAHRYANRINELTNQPLRHVNSFLMAQPEIQRRVYRAPELFTIYQDRTYLVTDLRTGISKKLKRDGTPETGVMRMGVDDTLALRETLKNVESQLYSVESQLYLIAQPLVDGANLGLYDGLLNGLDRDQRIHMHIQALSGE